MKKFLLNDRTVFLVAICIPFIALAVQWSSWSFFRPFVWFLFYPSVFFSARLGGIKAGIISTILSVLIVWFFFMPPSFSFRMDNPNSFYSIVVFVIMGFLMSDMQERLSNAKKKAVDAFRDAQLAREKVSELYERAVESEELKTHFFTNVSHELRTPLTLILNPLAEMLSREDLEESTRNSLLLMERNAHLLLRHISDLLDISKLEAKQMNLQYSRINAIAYIRLVASYFESVASTNHIQYKVFSPDVLVADIDHAKFQRILQNLISNAFKFTPVNGIIEINVSERHENLFFEIMDSGPGIPEENRNKIFERFQQINRAGEREYGGTGLGLAIVREFVELHNGQVSIVDSPFGGATFRLELPLHAPEGTVINLDNYEVKPDTFVKSLFSIKTLLAKDTSNGSTINNKLASILIVDDNQDISDFIAKALSSEFLVITASNGKEGIEKALLIKPDLIITDIMMPIMSGEVMVEKIREHPSIKDIPIIILSAIIDEKIKLALLNRSVQDFLIKPFSIEELIAKVRNTVTTNLNREAKVVEMEHRFKYALDNMLEGCQILDKSWKYSYINASAEKHNRRPKEELLGQQYTDMWPGIEQTEVYMHIKECLEQQVPHYMVNEFHFPDGAFGWFELSIYPVPEGVFILSVDVTDRKIAEEKIKASEADLKKAQKIAGLGYWTWYIQEDRLSLSDEMFALLGLEPDQFDGKMESVSKLLHADDKEVLNKNIEKIIQSGIAESCEYRIIWKDGSVHHFWAEPSELICDDNDKPCVLKGIIQDITKQRFTEMELIRAKERAEESDRLKSAFLANMSHEIRTPMNAIIGFSDLLTKPDFDEIKRASFTRIIQKKSYDLLQIIEDILDISKIEVGQMKIQLSNVRIAPFLRELHTFYSEQLKTLYEKPDLCIRLALPTHADNFYIETDIQRLKQVFCNLLDNAIKFTEEGAIEFGIKQETDTELIFYVKDTGIGIEPDKKEIIFDRFRQADDAQITKLYGGTGLGLSIVKGILNVFHSSIWVESDIGKGSTFSFNYPLSNVVNDIEPNELNSKSKNSWHDKWVLIVEDDEANYLYLAELLNGTGLNILHASTGIQALELFRQYSFIELVLMDIRLPDNNGLKLTSTFKQINPKIIVLAQTAYATPDDIRDCINAGCDGYISKPINPILLFELMDKYLSVH